MNFSLSYVKKSIKKIIKEQNKGKTIFYAFYNFITDNVWGIVVIDVLVRKNGARSEAINELATVNLASQATSPAPRATIEKLGIR